MAADPADRSTQQTTRRRRVVFGVVVVALLASVGGVIASARVKSPQQQIADAKGPGATLLTAPVEFRALGSDLTVNGQVGATSTISFTPTLGAQSEGSGVITALPKAVGAQIKDGEVIAEIDGRPVIALPGRAPAYRDLLPGSQGQDVAELQRSLRALGEDPGDKNDVYGAGTKAAIANLYDRLGYEPALAGDETELRSLTTAVRMAERARDDARTTLAATPAKSPERKAAEVTRSRAAEDLAEARAELAHAQATSGPMLPSGEVVFLPHLPARVTSVKGAVGSKIGADPLLTIAGGQLVVDVEVQEDDLNRVAKNSPVEVTVDADPALSGHVTNVGAVNVSDTGQRIAIARVTTDEALPESSYGKVVRVAIKPKKEPTETLVVPLAAVFSDANADAYVAVVRDDVKTRVVVSVGQIVDGYASITPNQGSLKAGDAVVVGTVAQNAAPNSAQDTGTSP